MQISAEERALIWLCACTGADYRTRVSLLRVAQNPIRLMEEWEKFCRLVIKGEKIGVYNSEPSCREREVDALLAQMNAREEFAVTLMSDDYPVALKHIPEPPLVLFGKGNRALLNERKFCVVGSRRTPAWAGELAREITSRVAKHFTVVTGFAEGGDRAAIDGALDSGNLICVLPCGLGECYPAAHTALKERIEKKGLLLSEYPSREKLKPYYFHARNRILAGLGEGVFVLSAGEKSGALITANYALEYGRDVFAFPYSPNAVQGAGCNDLIKKGAYLVSESEDILSVYGIEEVAKREISLNEEETKLLSAFENEEELHVAVIAERAQIQLYEALALLSALEIKGVVVKTGGNRYSLV